PDSLAPRPDGVLHESVRPAFARPLHPGGQGMAETDVRTRNPWSWVPSLYIAEGLPYVIVNSVSVAMYKKLGVSNTDAAFYTSLLYLAWVAEPLCPHVDD